MPKATKHAGDALRDVPPREFVRARDALAARLAEEGKGTEAREIRRLPRPSPVVWALNRTAVAQPRALNALIQAVDRLRRAQLGQGELRTATEGYRTVFEPVVRSAVDTLHDTASAGSPALERRLRSTLLAAVTDRQLRADLMAGRLTGEQTEPGFAVLSQGPIPAEFLRDRPAPPRSAPVREAKVVRAAPAQTDRAGASRPARPGEADARRRAQQAGRAARQAQQAARALGRDAHQKERAAQAAEKELATLRKTLEKREQQSAVLRAAADQAREASAKADERARAATSRTD